MAHLNIYQEIGTGFILFAAATGLIVSLAAIGQVIFEASQTARKKGKSVLTDQSFLFVCWFIILMIGFALWVI